MHIKGWKFLHNFFTLLCILATIALVIWCCYEFSKNEDVCEILFKNFQEDKDSLFPELTFGLQNRLNEKESQILVNRSIAIEAEKKLNS